MSDLRREIRYVQNSKPASRAREGGAGGGGPRPRREGDKAVHILYTYSKHKSGKEKKLSAQYCR